MKKFTIYKLIDPTNGIIRYVGMTSSTLKARLKRHLRDRSNIKKWEWIQKLKNIGRIPIIKPIVKLNFSENYGFWDKGFFEGYYIKAHKETIFNKGLNPLQTPKTHKRDITKALNKILKEIAQFRDGSSPSIAWLRPLAKKLKQAGEIMEIKLNDSLTDDTIENNETDRRNIKRDSELRGRSETGRQDCMATTGRCRVLGLS